MSENIHKHKQGQINEGNPSTAFCQSNHKKEAAFLLKAQQGRNHISHAVSKCHGFAFFYYRHAFFFFTQPLHIKLLISLQSYPAGRGAEGLYALDVSLPLFYVHVSLEPEGQCKANVSFIPC